MSQPKGCLTELCPPKCLPDSSVGNLGQKAPRFDFRSGDTFHSVGRIV